MTRLSDALSTADTILIDGYNAEVIAHENGVVIIGYSDEHGGHLPVHIANQEIELSNGICHVRDIHSVSHRLDLAVSMALTDELIADVV